jgi:hypothetical protein
LEQGLKRTIKRAGLFLLILALPFIALSAVHITFSLASYSEIERRGLPEKYHNAIKHAFAASEFYSLARLVLAPEQAHGLVVKLGEINEWVERYIKHDTDVSTEVYKDLRNNIVGIAAAEFVYAQDGYVSPCARLRLIGRLTADGELAAYAEDKRIPALPPGYDTGAAVARMEQDEPALRKQLDARLAARSAELRKDIGLD